MTDIVQPPPRPYAADEQIHGFNVRFGWFWNVKVAGKPVVSFDPDLVDPARYGVKDASAFTNLIARDEIPQITWFQAMEGWHARSVGSSLWTPCAGDRLEALREAYKRQEEERARYAARGGDDLLLKALGLKKKK